MLGEKYNIPVIFNAPGVPYYFDKKYQKIIKSIMDKVEYISVRDEESKSILEACGIKNIKVVPDTILCINEIFTQEELKKINVKLVQEKRVPKIDNYIAIQHNRSNIDNKIYIDTLRETIDYLTEKYNYNVLLVPIGYVHNDAEFMKKIYKKSNKKVKMVEGKLSPLEMLSVFANSKGYIGTSMHGAVTTYAYGNPILILNIKRLVKIGGLLNNINQSSCEVKNINDLKNKIDTEFFKKHKKNNAVKNINKHFDKIKSIINDEKGFLKKLDYEDNNLIAAYDTLSENIDDDLYEAKIYLDYGDGYFEDNILKAKWEYKKNKKVLIINIPDDVKSIRIDPIENYIVKYSYLKISSNKKTIDYNVNNRLKLNDKINIINSFDPQIIINDVNGLCEIILESDLEILKYENYIYVFNKLKDMQNDFAEIEKQYNNLKITYNIIISRFNKTIYGLLIKIKNKITKK